MYHDWWMVDGLFQKQTKSPAFSMLNAEPAKSEEKKKREETIK